MNVTKEQALEALNQVSGWAIGGFGADEVNPVATLRAYIEQAWRDAERYQWLRTRDLGAINNGGVFAGLTPDNKVINGIDLDRAIDACIGETEPPSLISVLQRCNEELNAHWEPPTEYCADDACPECNDNRAAMTIAGVIQIAIASQRGGA